MEIRKWENGEGYTVKITDAEAEKLRRELEDPYVTMVTLDNLEIEIGDLEIK